MKSKYLASCAVIAARSSPSSRVFVAAVLPAERADRAALLRAVSVLRPLVQQRAPQDAAPRAGPAQEPARRRVRAAAQRGQAAAPAALHHPQAAAQRPHAGGAAGHLLRAGRHRVPGAQHPRHAHVAPGREEGAALLVAGSVTSRLMPCDLCCWLPQKKCSYRVNKAFHGLAAGVRFSPTEGYAWDFSSKDKKEPVIPSEQLQLKLKQKYEKMEKQRENSARVDSILIQLMKKHAPEIAEKLENNNAAAAAGAGAPGAEDPAAIKRENDAAAGAEAAKRQKVA
ncbi:hypothetical protein ON010_g14701 [Phytophthora cinnamomi]|nr:hypothetical protein ON010_g14701 [Phytophthora cinnamomi]